MALRLFVVGFGFHGFGKDVLSVHSTPDMSSVFLALESQT